MLKQDSEEEIRVFKMEDFMLLTQQLERFHGIFSQLWQMGKPLFSREIPTACVQFDPEGDCILFLCNPDFWDTCSFEKKLFVICHECLHVLLNHGKRGLFLQQTGNDCENNQLIANKAMDVVINELLAAKYGFHPSLIDPKKEYCWLDTVFGEKWADTVVYNGAFEYYYNILHQKSQQTPKAGAGSGSSGSSSSGSGSGGNPQQTVDDHSGLDSFAKKAQIDEKIKEAINNLSEEEKASLKKNIESVVSPNAPGQESDSGVGGKQAGTGAGGTVIQLLLPKVKKKRKWETIIRKWAMRYLSDTYSDHEQWARKSRRMSEMSPNFFLPSEAEIFEPDFDKRRIRVAFFLDTSGSCAHLADRFFKAARTLPEDRFEIDLYCFDTSVYKTDIKSGKLYGFGGTSFSCIETYIQANIKKVTNKYPDGVMIITDGWGDHVNPEHANRWYWFLSENCKTYIPKASNTFMLKDFE